MNDRRTFLATLAAAAAPTAFAKPLPSIGVQLYTVRSIIDGNPKQVLSDIEKIGYKEVEAISANIDQIWDSLKQTRMKPVSMHLPTAVLTGKSADLGPALDNAARKGFRFVVCPALAKEDRNAEGIQRVAEALTNAGRQAKRKGLTLCYHNHAFEFNTAGGGTLLDLLLKSSDPKLLQLELDIMWATVAGADVPALLQKYHGRVPLVHVKDVAKGTETRLNEGIPRTAFKEAGQGAVDMPKVLAAAMKARVQHYFVEQDQTPGPPLESLKISYDYLSSLNL